MHTLNFCLVAAITTFCQYIDLISCMPVYTRPSMSKHGWLISFWCISVHACPWASVLSSPAMWWSHFLFMPIRACFYNCHVCSILLSCTCSLSAIYFDLSLYVMLLFYACTSCLFRSLRICCSCSVHIQFACCMFGSLHAWATCAELLLLLIHIWFVITHYLRWAACSLLFLLLFHLWHVISYIYMHEQLVLCHFGHWFMLMCECCATLLPLPLFAFVLGSLLIILIFVICHILTLMTSVLPHFMF